MAFRNDHNDSVSIERGPMTNNPYRGNKRSAYVKESGYVGPRLDAHQADS